MMPNKRKPTTKPRQVKQLSRLPEFLRPLFWEVYFGRLRWERDGDYVIGRVLEVGDWKAVCWLRKKTGDAAIREFLMRRKGRGFSRRQIRYWELILELPADEVNAWLADPRRSTWDQRADGNE